MTKEYADCQGIDIEKVLRFCSCFEFKSRLKFRNSAIFCHLVFVSNRKIDALSIIASKIKTYIFNTALKSTVMLWDNVISPFWFNAKI